MSIGRKIWEYFRSSIEGDDHKFSYRRFSQFLFMHLLIVLALRGITSQWEFYTFLTVSINFALTSAILTVQQLILMIKYWSKKNGTADFFQSTDEQTIKHEDTESVDALNSNQPKSE